MLKKILLIPKLIKFIIVSIRLKNRLKKNKNKNEKNRKEKHQWSKFIINLLEVDFNKDSSIEYSKDFRLEDNLLLISNHRSFLDILIIEQVIQKLNNKNSSFIAKKELLKIPIVGNIIKSFGTLFIDRGNPRDFITLLKTIKKQLKETEKDNIFVIFPEGTRDRIINNKGMNSFKEGYLKIAQKNSLNILPIFIEGNTENYLENIGEQKNPIKVHIFNIINIENKTNEEIENKYNEEVNKVINK